MVRHILVPTDGSPLSTKAAKAAARLARACKARITAFHAIPPFSAPGYMDGTIGTPELLSPTEYKKSTERYARKILARVEAQAKAAGVRCASVIVTADQPWKAIIKEARARRCDLIAMASNGRRGLAGLLLGSETNKVLTHSKIPVLVLR